MVWVLRFTSYAAQLQRSRAHVLTWHSRAQMRHLQDTVVQSEGQNNMFRGAPGGVYKVPQDSFLLKYIHLYLSVQVYKSLADIGV